MTSKLKIEFRQKQLYYRNDKTQPIVMVCGEDGNPTYSFDKVPLGDWVDMSDYVEGLEAFKPSWQAVSEDYTGSSGGDSANGSNDLGSNYKKGITANLRFTGLAFDFIYGWMLSSPCQLLNEVEVKITDLDCGRAYRLFEIKMDNLRWKPQTEPCVIETALTEVDDAISFFETTIIEDDWQGWFGEKAEGVKDHPTFMYCVQKEPKFLNTVLLVVVYMAGILSGGILTTFNFAKVWIRKLLGIAYFCPSPLVRTYIENICLKYGYTWDTMFDDKPENLYRNVCLFFPVVEYYKNFEGLDSEKTKFLFDNRTGLAMNQFLDKLKVVFNAEWYVTPGKKLVFQPKSYFQNQTPVYDFTAPGAYPVWNLIYEFNGNKKPAYGTYQWDMDGQDLEGNDIKWRYDTIVNFSKDTYNPAMGGSLQKNFPFAPTAFVKDGTSREYIENEIEDARAIAAAAVLAGLIALLIGVNPLTAAFTGAAATLGYVLTNDYVHQWANNPAINGAVRVSFNVVNKMRLLLWDGVSMTNAKVVKELNPQVNGYYNTEGRSYDVEHPPYDGAAIEQPKYNYPMYVDEMFTGNLYDRFHEIDNPLRSTIINQDFEMDIDMCCTTLDTLGVWENDFIKIGAVIVIEKRAERLIKGRITDIIPDYAKGNIHLKGNLLK